MEKQKTLIENNLKSIRLSKGLTLDQVAKLMGLYCADRLSHWEKGRAMPSVVNLLKLSSILCVKPEEIYPVKWG